MKLMEITAHDILRNHISGLHERAERAIREKLHPENCVIIELEEQYRKAMLEWQFYRFKSQLLLSFLNEKPGYESLNPKELTMRFQGSLEIYTQQAVKMCLNYHRANGVYDNGKFVLMDEALAHDLKDYWTRILKEKMDSQRSFEFTNDLCSKKFSKYLVEKVRGLERLTGRLGKWLEDFYADSKDQFKKINIQVENDAALPQRLQFQLDFLLAAKIGNMKLLLKSVQSLKSLSRPLLKLFAHQGNLINFTIEGESALSSACLYGHYQIVEYLLKNGANVDIKDSAGYRPIHHAVRYESEFTIRILKLLKQHGANLDSYGEYNRTPLSTAVVCANYSATKWLIANGADINARESNDASGYTVLHTAIYRRRTAIVKLLLENTKLDVTIQDKNPGETPLVAAFTTRQKLIIREFFLKGHWLSNDEKSEVHTFMRTNNIPIITCDLMAKEFEKNRGLDVPSEYLCKISNQVMTDPVFLSDGFIYDRNNIEAWLRDELQISPMSGRHIEEPVLSSMLKLKESIQRWQEESSTPSTGPNI